jgi:PDZ domain-containing secreted protein
MLHHPEKNDDKINAIIDEAVDLADDLIARVNSSKKLKSGKEMKTSFQIISDELQDKAIGYIEKLNAL